MCFFAHSYSFLGAKIKDKLIRLNCKCWSSALNYILIGIVE